MEAHQPEGRILVADDDACVREFVEQALGSAGYAVELAGTLREARKLMRTQCPDLMILDLGLPDGDGIDLLAELRRSVDSARVPALILSGFDDRRVRVAGLDAGANDFLVKPIDSDELLARVRAHLRVAKRAEALHRGSCVDPLSGLLNRHGFDLHIQAAIDRAERERSPLAIAFFDLDGLKQINDRLGHAVGDEVICRFAGVISRGLRSSDLAARWGGDEFVACLPGSNRRSSFKVAQRIQRAAGRLRVPGLGFGVGVSVGVASLGDEADAGAAGAADLLVAAADRAMYDDKARRGRGAAAIASEEVRS